MFSNPYKIELDVFEGPLDLLLHLVKKHELDILDIPICFITEKYLQYLSLMKTMNLEVAGEYLLMAATLAYIKSKELLPPDPNELEDDFEGLDLEEMDPRQELIRRLLEYQKYKNAGADLASRPVMGRNVWLRGLPQEDSITTTSDIDPLETLSEFPVVKLIAALDKILSKAKIEVTHDVTIERLSVSQCINELIERLEKEGQFTFSSCFRFLKEPMSAMDARQEAVTVFLSILEMAKLSLIKIAQTLGEDGDGDIVIARSMTDLREHAEHALASGAEYH